jgi:hypothetical protein
MRVYMAERRRVRRLTLIDLLGGACTRCGETSDLQFDHVVPGSQGFRVGRGLDKPWAEILAEVAKCQLLCDPCHHAKSAECGETSTVEHGGGKTGKHGCKCAPCKARKAEYARNRRKSISDSEIGITPDR